MTDGVVSLILKSDILVSILESWIHKSDSIFNRFLYLFLVYT